MRAMILAAGLGTRMGALSELCAKPALPVRGTPVIATLLHLLHHHGVRELMVNLHHRPDSVREAVEAYRPPGLAIDYSPEARPLGTGGGIRRAADFLRESDPSLVLAGDMLLDLDLSALIAEHRLARRRVTLALAEDSRAAEFGSIGIDAEGKVRRIGRRFDLGGETRCGVFVSVRVLAARALDSLPERERFEDLSDWLAPQLEAGADDIHGRLYAADACTWEPVGTPAEYLAVGLAPPRLSYLDLDALAQRRGVRVERGLVVGAGAQLGEGARLSRALVWDGERVPARLRAQGGVFAGGVFHSCASPAAPDRGQP